MEVIEKNLSDSALALLTNNSSSKKAKKALFDSNIILSFVGKLTLPKSTIRAKLPHRSAGIDVCIIVKDLKPKDYEASNDLWKRKWRADGGGPKAVKATFLSLTELKVCYQNFESRRKLAATFDVFLADERIVHHLPTNLGKAFYGKNRDKVPMPVTLAGKNLVEVVDDALQHCLVLLSGKGSLESVVIGNCSLSNDQIKENILSVTRDVVGKLPGCISALRSVYVRGVGPSIPIYYDNAEVEKEEVQSKLKEMKVQAVVSSELNYKLPTKALVEAVKTLPIDENDLKVILKIKDTTKLKRIAKSKKVGQAKKKKLGRKGGNKQ